FDPGSKKLWREPLRRLPYRAVDELHRIRRPFAFVQLESAGQALLAISEYRPFAYERGILLPNRGHRMAARRGHHSADSENLRSSPNVRRGFRADRENLIGRPAVVADRRDTGLQVVPSVNRVAGKDAVKEVTE